MFDTALTVNDLIFLAKGAGMTILVTAISVFFGTILGIVFGVVRSRSGRGGPRRWPSSWTSSARSRS